MLFGFFVRRMFFAELAIFVEFQTVRIVLFIFIGLVVALLTLRASQRDCITHTAHLFNRIYILVQNAAFTIYHNWHALSIHNGNDSFLGNKQAESGIIASPPLDTHRATKLF